MPVHTNLYDYWFEFCDTEPTPGRALRRAVKAGYGPFEESSGRLKPLKDLEAFRLAEARPAEVILVQNKFSGL